jgi:hypothetical protein
MWGFYEFAISMLVLHVVVSKPNNRNMIIKVITQKKTFIRIITYSVLVKYESVMNAFSWDVKPCGSCNKRRFGGMERLHHQGDKNRWARNSALMMEALCSSETSILIRATHGNIPEDGIHHWFIFHWMSPSSGQHQSVSSELCPDDGGVMFLRNVGSYKSRAA